MKSIEKTANRYIYKYSSLNEFLLRTLINNELYFSNPSDFNDPFDCQFKLNLVKNSEAENQFYKNLDLSDSEKKLFNLFQFENENSKGLENTFNLRLIERLGVTCFSEQENEILMWSHYANGHKGICLKFDWNIHPDYFQGDKVIYDNKLHTIEYSSTQKFHNEIKRVVLTKLERWSYEKEIRSVVEIGASGKRNLSFNPKALVGIIFGDKVNIDDIQLIKRTVSLHEDYSHVKFYKATMIREESKIKINAM
jgi:hypothetical protein